MHNTESLDNVVFRSLTGGTHSRLAQRRGRAVRYPVEVSRFAALPDQPQRRDWDDLAALAGTSGGVALANYGAEPPESWTALSRFTVVQMIDDEVDARPDPDMLYLSDEDVPEMLQLVARTKPGPFAPRTIDMGSYIGLAGRDGSSPWPASDSVHRGGPKSVPSARLRSFAAAGWRLVSCRRSRPESGSAARLRFCTWRPPTRKRSPSMKPWASRLAEPSRS